VSWLPGLGVDVLVCLVFVCLLVGCFRVYVAVVQLLLSLELAALGALMCGRPVLRLGCSKGYFGISSGLQVLL
jgi:hypothetical protein